MDSIRNLILNAFDIRKLSKECNFPKCDSRVYNEIFIYEYTTKRKVGLATLYLCKNHTTVANAIVKEIKEMAPNKIIQSQIGRVAQN